MDEEEVVGVPGEKAAGEEQRGDGDGSGLQEAATAWLVGHGVLFSVQGLQIEGGTEPPPSSRLSPPLLCHRALQPVGGRHRGKLPLGPSG